MARLLGKFCICQNYHDRESKNDQEAPPSPPPPLPKLQTSKYIWRVQFINNLNIKKLTCRAKATRGEEVIVPAFCDEMANKKYCLYSCHFLSRARFWTNPETQVCANFWSSLLTHHGKQHTNYSIGCNCTRPCIMSNNFPCT